MVTGSDRKTVLVLSDDDRLSRAIELSLNQSIEVKIIRLAPPSSAQRSSQAEVGDFDLMVVAMSSPTGEPVVALAKASLAKHIGLVPLLIISDKPFSSDLDSRIAHLDFPFDPHAIQDKVRELLRGEPLEGST